MTTQPPRYRQSTFWKDWGERVLWTLLEAAIAVLIVESPGFLADGELPQWAIPLIASALAALKGYVARKLVDRHADSASTVPGV